MRIILLIGLLAFSHATLWAGGWPQPRLHGYFKVGQSLIRAGQFFAGTGEIVDITTTSVYQTSLYGEYGITDRLTGLVYAPLFVRSTIDRQVSTVNMQEIPGDAFQGVGNIDVGAKYGLITQGPVVVAATLWLSLPTGQNVGGNSELLQTGDGAFSQLLQLEASHSFYPKPYYATVLGGFRHRGQATYAYANGPVTVDYSDEARWGAELGWTPKSWVLALKVLQVIPLGNGNNAGETGASSLFGNNIAYFSFTPEATYQISPQLGVSAAAGLALSARNILAAPTWQAGLVWILDPKED